MTPLLLSLSLTAPAQHPVAVPPPITVAPNVRVMPQISGSPYTRPGVAPAYRPPYPVVPAQPQPLPVVPPAVTLAELSRFFTPTPGKHDVWVVHPDTRQPVKVCFVLPPGKLEDFEVGRRSIRFEFCGGKGVEIDFRKNGTVRVDYDD